VDKNKNRIFIQRIQDLPTLPTTLLKIIEVVENPESSAHDLADIVSKDQSISSVILRLVNSAFYGHLRQISSISHAVVILGYQTVKTMALGVSIFQSPPTAGGHSFDRGKFWVHSIGVATLTKRLSEKVKPVAGLDRDSVFLSGLLHDVGKVVFDNYFNEEYGAVVGEAMKRRQWIGDFEAEAMGMTHAEAGYYLAQKWQFPAPVIDSIRYHHALHKCPPNSLPVASLVHIADAACRRIRLGSGGDDAPVDIDPLAMKTLGIDDDLLADLMLELDGDREGIESFALRT
jgi:putative nucleotidyltransferase with HDIG domain